VGHDRKASLRWHEGVNIFGERMAQTEVGRLRIDYPENDVTTAQLSILTRFRP
jgi:hypothetical protein